MTSTATLPAASSRNAAMVWMTIGIVCSAGSGIFPKLANLPGPSSAFWRFAIALAAMALIVSLASAAGPRFGWLRRRTRLDRRTIWLLIAAGAAIAADIVMWNQALLMVSVNEAMLLGNTAPLWVGLSSWFLLGQRPRVGFWIACALALVGMAVFVGVHLQEGSQQSLLGMALCLLAGVSYSIYLLLTHEARKQADVASLLLITNAAGLVVSLAVALVVGAPLWGYPAITWLWLVLMALFSGVLGWWAIAQAMGALPATTVSLGLMGMVPLAGLIAWPVFGETMTLIQMVGALLLFIAIVIGIRNT